MAKKGGNMKNKTIYYTISALFWLLVGVLSYHFYLFQNNEGKTEKNLIASANEIYDLHNLGLDKYEILRKRDNNYDISLEYAHPRGKILLDTISMVEGIVDSLEIEETIHFLDVEFLYNRDYFQDNTELHNLKFISTNENIYNKSDLYGLLYKNALLKTLRNGNMDRYSRIGSVCSWGKGFGLGLQIFDKNKIGLAYGNSFYDIVYCNYPKTTSNSFEFETVVEKLGRNHHTIRTRYKTTPKEGQELGIYDYEVIIEK